MRYWPKASLVGGVFLLVGLGLGISDVSQAATYPDRARPITLIVPWAPGGSVDVFARIFSGPLQKELGTNIQIVNKPGAGAQVGMTEVARAKPDGYTLGVASLPGIITIYLDPARKAVFNGDSFAKIAMTGNDPEAVAVTGKSPYRTIADLAAAARADPGKTRLAVGGLMGDSHLGGILLERSIGSKLAVVTFDGGLTPALVAMMGGHMDAYVGVPSSLVAVVKAGDVRIIGIMDVKRSTLLPDVPTLKEQGFEDAVMGASRGIVGPAGLPQDVAERLALAVERAMASAEVQKSLAGAWSAPSFLGPKAFAAEWKHAEERVKDLMKRLANK